MVYLLVRFTVGMQDVETYERIFAEEFLPLIRDAGIEMVGAFKTLVGDAGEFHELWRFQDAADFERRWHALFEDPGVRAIVARTGPLVRGESSRLLTLAPFSPVL